MLREAREKAGFSQIQLAKILGVSERTIRNYEKDETLIQIGTLKKLCDILNINTSVFIPTGFSMDKMSIVPMDKVSIEDNLTEVPMSDLIQIPLLHHISASAGQGAINELPAEIEYRGFTKEILRESFGVLGGYQDIFIIHSFGNSMFPTIPLKALLLVQKGNPLEGQICVARIGGEMLVKRLAKFPKIRLLSDNKEYEPITISEEMDFEVIGRVVGYFGVL